MPVKNTGEFLPVCLDSIINQSWLNWELIAVDDGSTDDSYEILCKYGSEDSRIKVLKNNGKGIIDALRLAYKTSQGEFITRMDSDDIMKPQKLKTLQSLLVNKGIGHVVSGKVKYFANYDIGDGFQKYETWLNSLIEKGSNYDDIYKECVIPSPSWMVYQSDLEKCGAFEPNDYPEDYDLIFRFYEYGLKCIPCPDVLHLWRDYQTRTSRTDKNYADNSFLDIKLKYFLKLEYQKEKVLLLWGAGKKGKRLATLLNEKQIPFRWICDNPNKIGKDIHGVILEDVNQFSSFTNYQSIVAIASPEAKKQIKKSFSKADLKNNIDFCFFC